MIITYNHARYIGAAIDSVLAQDADFPFVIHVIDDCSTDGTQDIVRAYAARHPGAVKAFINPRNIGSKVTQRNFHRGFSTLDGDYVSILEGDDYWVTTDRLQKHVAYLEANPGFVACACQTLKVYEDGSGASPHIFEPNGPRLVPEEHGIEDLIRMTSFFHASSLTFRNVFRGRTPAYLRSPLSCDIFIAIAHAQFGKIRFFPEIGSVYRAHAGGLFSQMSQTKGLMWNLDSLVACNRWLRFRYWRIFAVSIWKHCDKLLAQGVEADGLTPARRRFYGRLRRRYRRLETLGYRFDVLTAAWRREPAPGEASRKLNLGCGRRLRHGLLNVDVRTDVDPDLVVDLERTPWPFPDDYACEVYFERSLEHMAKDGAAFQRLMGELYRICRPNAHVRVIAKHPWGRDWASDPTCVRPVTPALFGQFDATLAQTIEPRPHSGGRPMDFELTEAAVVLDEPYKTEFAQGRISPAEASRLVDTTLNVCSDFNMELRVHKPPRAPSGRPVAP